MTREEDVSRKIEIVRNYIISQKKDGALISNVENFAWLTSGARSYVALSDSIGSASVLITRKDAYVITKNIEALRLKKEELPENFKIIEFEWFSDVQEAVKKVADGQNLLFEDEPQFSAFLLNSRIKLGEFEIERFAQVGERSARALERAVRKITPDITELNAKGLVEQELANEGLDSLLVLVFGDESRSLYRHNLPRNVKIGKKCFASICSKKYGLIISSTRTVEFGRDEKFEAQYIKNMEIESEILDSTYRSNSIGQVFFDIEKAYASHGYPDEWRLHHQGGIAGYKTREVVAIPHMSFEIPEGVSFAWNPTVTGTKMEDTYVKTRDGMKLLSVDSNGKWPYAEVKINGRIYRRPNILNLS
jgi:Xaa-Pro dipeptidase